MITDPLKAIREKESHIEGLAKRFKLPEEVVRRRYDCYWRDAEHFYGSACNYALKQGAAAFAVAYHGKNLSAHHNTHVYFCRHAQG